MGMSFVGLQDQLGGVRRMAADEKRRTGKLRQMESHTNYSKIFVYVSDVPLILCSIY